jgi:hypothetical protein
MKNAFLPAKYIPAVLLFAITVGCESQSPIKAELSEPPAVFAPALDAAHGNTKYETAPVIQEQAEPRANPDQKIIRKANLRFQVADFKKSTEAINQVIPQY